MSKNSFTGSTAKFFVTILIGLIIASFALTTIGTGGMSSVPGSVAEVGNYSISLKEYKTAYTQIQRQYQQIFQGQAVPASLSDSMEKSAMTRLVNQKIILNLSDTLNLNTSPKEIKKTIKQQDAFLTEKQFDFTKYKNLLKANGFTTKSYESSIENDLRSQKFYELLAQIKSSSKYTSDVSNIKNSFLPITVAKVESYPLRKFIPVSKSEVSDFISKKENLPSLKALYQEQIATYQQPAKYTYRTIFFSKLGKDDAAVKTLALKERAALTAKNFASTATKKSDDTVTKTKGGLVGTKTLSEIQGAEKTQITKLKAGEISSVYKTSLGYSILYLENLKKAVSTPLASVQDTLAKTAIQRSKTNELDILYKKVIDEAKVAIKDNDSKKIKSLSKQYGFQVNEDTKLTRFTNEASGINFKEENTTTLFNSKSGDVNAFDRVTYTLVAKVLGEQQTTKTDDKSNEADQLQGEITRKAIESYRAKNEVTINPNFQVR